MPGDKPVSRKPLIVIALNEINFDVARAYVDLLDLRNFRRAFANGIRRTTAEESARLGEEIGRKLSAATGPAAVLLPLAGVSAIDRQGQPFDDPVARQALFAAIRQHLSGVELLELDCHINDPQFALAAANRLIAMIGARHRTSTP